MSKTTQKRSKLIIILVSVMLGLIGIGAIAVSFVLNYNTYAPTTPVVLDDGQNFYVSTALNDNYKGYRFKFVDKNDKEIIIDSKENQLSVQQLLENDIKLGQRYQISVCYLAENVGNNSKYSKSTLWLCQSYLEMPIATFDQTTYCLNWQKIEGADYYRVYVSGEDDYFETTETTYSLHLLEGGDKTVNVVAFSENKNYLTSNKSNTVQIKLVRYLQPFDSIEFNSESKIITAKSSVKYPKIKIYLDQAPFECTIFDIEKVEDEYVYKIDITTIYKNETSIGISPCDIDEYNLFQGAVVYYQVQTN